MRGGPLTENACSMRLLCIVYETCIYFNSKNQLSLDKWLGVCLLSKQHLGWRISGGKSSSGFLLWEFGWSFISSLLLWQIITNIVASKATNLSSYSSAGQKSNLSLTGLKSKCLQGGVSFWGLQGRTHSLAFSAPTGCPHSFRHGPLPPRPSKPTGWSVETSSHLIALTSAFDSLAYF